MSDILCLQLLLHYRVLYSSWFLIVVTLQVVHECHARFLFVHSLLEVRVVFVVQMILCLVAIEGVGVIYLICATFQLYFVLSPVLISLVFVKILNVFWASGHE